MGIYKPGNVEPKYGEHEGERLAGFDNYELEKISSLQNMAERVAHQVKFYKAMKDFAARHGVDVTGIDLADDFATTGTFQQRNQEKLSKAGDGRDYLIVILSTLSNAITELQNRIDATDISLRNIWREEHPEFFNLPNHLL